MVQRQRRFSSIFCGENWTPLVPTRAANVYANGWQGDGVRLWTLVDRSENEIGGPLLEIEVGLGEHIYDVISGCKSLNFEATLAPRGVGGFVVAAPEKLGVDWAEFLASQAETYARADFRTEIPERDTFPMLAAACALRSAVWSASQVVATEMEESD